MKKHKKRRGGRPRVEGVEREANGRISRKASAAKSFREAVLTRARVHGLTEQDASDARAGSVVGRMCIQKAISRDQYDSAQRYIEVRHAYLRAIEVKQDFRAPKPETEGGGDYESFCRTAREKYDAMQDAIAALCQEQRSPAPAAALDVFINRDIYLPELEGDLRLALNALTRHFLEGRKRAV